ncbi:MAG TPA: hypothetical protein DCE26_00320, partial [Dehalococcoidia bacterium]|nr:hypothetical protein [Dehalococcoidia bacterium]
MATLTSPSSVSMDETKMERVKDLFQHQIEDGLHPGAGLAVYRYGQLVLDIHGGMVRPDSRKAVDSSTMFVLMS